MGDGETVGAVNPGIDVTVEQAAALMRSSTSVVLFTHRNPDGDAVGAVCALTSGLNALGKSTRMVCPDPLPRYLLAIPGAEQILTTFDPTGVDLFVSVDVSDAALLSPLAAAEPGFLAGQCSLNIDHHLSNGRYAQYNLVDASAAAATELVHGLLQALEVPLSAATASDLVYGIVNDTHSFQNSNTTPHTLRITADLLEAGADLSLIVFNLLLARSASSARLWAAVLPTLTFADGDRVAFLTVGLDALEKAGATMSDADGLVEFLRNIRDVDLAVLFKQTAPDLWRLSMRTSAAIDATQIARVFGGGGHRRAAGCDITGSIDAVQEQVLSTYASIRQLQGE